jgi:hypothetical protein
MGHLQILITLRLNINIYYYIILIYITLNNNKFKQTCFHWILKKTSLIQFLAKNSSHIPISVDCGNNIKFNITNIKFSGIMIDNTL